MKIKLKDMLICLLTLALLSGTPLLAQSDEKQEQEKKEDKAEELKYELADDATLEDAEKLFEAISKFRPANREQAIAHAKEMRTSMPKFYARVVELAEKAMKTDTPMYLDAKRYVLNTSLGRAMQKPEQAGQAIDDVANFLSSLKSVSGRDSQIAVMACYRLSSSRAKFEPGFKEEAYEKLAGVLHKTENKDAIKSAKMIEGIARRAKLVGTNIELAGTKMDGSAFDLKELNGKVVLVDFWATWCGPCIREHPNIEKNYEKYHEKGFEVVGISLDRDRARLEKFVEEKETKWIILHDKGANAATVTYGVVGIPSMFLIDRDGKVISTTARGPSLNKLLEKLFGDDDKGDDDKGDDDKGDDDKGDDDKGDSVGGK